MNSYFLFILLTMASNYIQISKEVQEFEKKWDNTYSQTEFFNRFIPKKNVDFTKTFLEKDLDKVFTATRMDEYGTSVPKIKTKKGYNCNSLYHQCMEQPDIFIACNDEFMALHPLGEPGMVLGRLDSRISHFMVVDRENHILNEALPSDNSELDRLQRKIYFIDHIYEILKRNDPISRCFIMDPGNPAYEQVSMIAGRSGQMISTEMPIRDFIALQISCLPQKILKGPPGYQLMYKGERIERKGYDFIKKVIDEVFTDDTNAVLKCIQSPDHCSQIVSHIHTFLIPRHLKFHKVNPPPEWEKTYLCVDSLWRVKRDLKKLSTMNQNDTIMKQKSSYF